MPRVSDLPNPEPPAAPAAGLAEDEALPIPIVTIGLLVMIVVIFAAMYYTGRGSVGAVATLFGEKENDLIVAGQKWRLLTAVFLHGSVAHLVVNGISLLWLGIQMERIYGSRKFFLVYLASGVAGNLFSFAFTSAPSLGASGAIFGLLGAGLIFPLRFSALLTRQERSQILRQVIPVVAINLGLNFLPFVERYAHLDQWAHIGGLVGGGIMALFLVPDALELEAVSPARNTLLWLVTALALSLMLWAGLMQWRWARSQTMVSVSDFVEYNRGQEPWWSFRLMRRWQDMALGKNAGQMPRGTYFTGPHGAVIRVLDSLQIPDLEESAETWLLQQNRPVQTVLLDGKLGKRLAVVTAARVMELCETSAFGQTVVFELECAPQDYPRCRTDFELLLVSARFIQPPAVALSPSHLPSMPALQP